MPRGFSIPKSILSSFAPCAFLLIWINSLIQLLLPLQTKMVTHSRKN